MTRIIIYLFGTMFFSGRSPVASGTAGSFVAILLYMAGVYFLPSQIFPIIQVVVIVVFIIAGIPAATYIANSEGKEDPGCIVVDEAIGQWITMLFMPPALIMAHISIPIAGFLLFRLFDIVKVFPANRAEKLPGGLGIVLDDVIAGLYACLVLNLIVKLVIL